MEHHVKKEKSMADFIKGNFSWIKDTVVVIGIIGMMYLQGHYVTVEKFEASSAANEAAHNTLIATLASMDKTLALMGRNQSDISALETQVKLNTGVLSTVVQQNKIDAEYNELFKDSATRLVEINGRVANIESLNLPKFVQETLVHRAERELRIKVLELAHPTLAPHPIQTIK